jgi:hypothetical protein
MQKIYAIQHDNLYDDDKFVLVGEFTNNNGQYSFRYLFGNTQPEYWWIIDEFPDPYRVYQHHEIAPVFEHLANVVRNNDMLEEICEIAKTMSDFDVVGTYFQKTIHAGEPAYRPTITSDTKVLNS